MDENPLIGFGGRVESSAEYSSSISLYQDRNRRDDSIAVYISGRTLISIAQRVNSHPLRVNLRSN